MVKKFIKWIVFIVNTVLISLASNVILLKNRYTISAFVLLLIYMLINLKPTVFQKDIPSKMLRNTNSGCELIKIFLFSVLISGIYFIIYGEYHLSFIIPHAIVLVVLEAIVFWNGIIRIYLTSKQLGLKWRVLGIVFGFTPIVNLIILAKILSIVTDEVQFETEKIYMNLERKESQICKTKYPILMVHGVFFRDNRYLNYWGRIPKELEENGAEIYYGNHHSAASVEECAKELTLRIRQIVEETGSDKVNIIAHSKGGLDCRYAIALEGAAAYVASLTTVNTPHRGCEFADYLLDKIPKGQQKAVASTYNATMKKLGDTNPDFMKAVTDLTATSCAKRNETIKDDPKVYYQSLGSKLNKASNGRFPLNLTYKLVNLFDGDNDGLVGADSFPWGENYQFMTLKGKRGISHADMIDLNRENIKGFDVREFYVQLVYDLKKKGF